MINLKKSTVVLIILMSFFYQNSIAQTQHEAGLRLNNFNQFSIIYKKQKNDKSFWRFRLDRASFSFQKIDNFDQLNGNLQFAIGLENRKALADKLSFIHGFEFGLGFSYLHFAHDYLTLSPSIGYLLGMQYEVTEHITMGVETIPSLSGNYLFQGKPVIINTGLYMGAVGMYITYQFEK